MKILYKTHVNSITSLIILDGEVYFSYGSFSWKKDAVVIHDLGYDSRTLQKKILDSYSRFSNPQLS